MPPASRTGSPGAASNPVQPGGPGSYNAPGAAASPGGMPPASQTGGYPGVAPTSYGPPATASSGRMQPAGDPGRAAAPNQGPANQRDRRSVESGYVAPLGNNSNYSTDSGYATGYGTGGYNTDSGYGTGGYGTDFGPAGGQDFGPSGGQDFGPAGYGDFGPTGTPPDRRSAESGYMSPVSRNSQDTGGRRRRAEGQPTWQDSWQQNGSTSGSHARPDVDSGSHATGRSVSDLIASNGGDANTPRRRRRRDD